MAKNAGSPTCNMKYFCHCGDRSIETPAEKPPPTTSCAAVPKKLDGVATRLLSGFTAAFFASLERCSCINIATKDDFDDSGSLPLIGDDIIYPVDDVGFTGNSKEEEQLMVGNNKDVIDVK